MRGRLHLRALEPEDTDMMYEAEKDEAAWRYSDYLAPLSREMLLQYALEYDADPLKSGQLRLIIDLDSIPIGMLDLFEVSARHLRAEIGIYILPQFRGKGYATQSLELAKNYCISRLGLHQLTASVAQRNGAAMRCFIKAGFLPTGKRLDWIRIYKDYEDVTLLSSILDSE